MVASGCAQVRAALKSWRLGQRAAKNRGWGVGNGGALSRAPLPQESVRRVLGLAGGGYGSSLTGPRAARSRLQPIVRALKAGVSVLYGQAGASAERLSGADSAPVPRIRSRSSTSLS